ncbi:MAG TPA: prepilin-type N-terminal cleavage/methylation domain-containing protein [Candidatus Saccharimonadales bacterium]
MLIKEKQSGFTIVELLVVIVVIAILASISTVAFNGVQDSARSAKMLAAIDAYTKGVQIYKSTNGNFPNPTPGSNVTLACLGPYPAKGVFGANSCVNGNGTDAAFSNTTLNTQFSSVLGNLPDVSDISIKSGGTEIRGISYNLTGATDEGFFIYYVPGQNQKCGRGVAQNVPSYNATECRVTFK